MFTSKMQADGGSQSKLPSVTVIMPIRNESTYIERSLLTVLDQDYPLDKVEILVVDGMSDDETRDIVANLASKHPQHVIRILDNPTHIVPPALNIGLLHAQGDIIIRVDGHCEIPLNYIRKCVKLLHETNADNVGGMQWSVGENKFARAVSLATRSPFGVGNAKFRYATKSGWVDTVYLGTYRREVFDRIGGFDEELMRNQDDEFNFRLLQSGGKIWLDTSLKVQYYSRSSLRKLWKQYFQYGLYKVSVIQKRGAVSSVRHLVPAFFVLFLVGSILIALLRGQMQWTLAVIVPYALINLVASVCAAKEDWKISYLLPQIFITLHLAYGTGFLAGLWHWRRDWGKAVEPKALHGRSVAK